MVGKSTSGSEATGSWKNAIAPAARIASVSSVVAIGRVMNGAEIFIGRAYSAGAAASPASRFGSRPETASASRSKAR